MSLLYSDSWNTMARKAADGSACLFSLCIRVTWYRLKFKAIIHGAELQASLQGNDPNLFPSRNSSRGGNAFPPPSQGEHAEVVVVQQSEQQMGNTVIDYGN